MLPSLYHERDMRAVQTRVILYQRHADEPRQDIRDEKLRMQHVRDMFRLLIFTREKYHTPTRLAGGVQIQERIALVDDAADRIASPTLVRVCPGSVPYAIEILVDIPLRRQPSAGVPQEKRIGMTEDERYASACERRERTLVDEPHECMQSADLISMGHGDDADVRSGSAGVVGAYAERIGV